MALLMTFPCFSFAFCLVKVMKRGVKRAVALEVRTVTFWITTLATTPNKVCVHDTSCSSSSLHRREKNRDGATYPLILMRGTDYIA